MLNEKTAGGVILDISALDVVDSFMARVFNDTAHMVRLLGAKVVVCGIQPSVALTLIEMGRELIGVDTALNLDQAVERLNSLLGRQNVLHTFSEGVPDEDDLHT